MSNIGLVKDEGSIFVEEEITEGVKVDPTAGASAVEVLSDGLDFTPTKNLVARDNRTSTVETVKSRVGEKSMAGTIPTEFKAGVNEGDVPETNALYKSLLGERTDHIARISLLGHTATKIFLTAGEELQYKKGQIVKVNQSAIAGVDHVSPIASIDSGLGVESITLLIPYAVPFSDNVEIAKGVNYSHKSGQPTVTTTEFKGGKVKEQGIGMRVASAEMSDFSTGNSPKMSFTLEGLDFDRNINLPAFSPSYDSELGALPPIVLCSKVYKDATEIIVNSVGMTLTNTLGFLTSTASKSGKISSRVTKFEAGFTINPYMQDDNVEFFDIFSNNTSFNLFGSSHNEGATEDEHEQVIAFNMPNCVIPEITTADEDGIITDNITGQAHKTLGNDTVFIAFI